MAFDSSRRIALSALFALAVQAVTAQTLPSLTPPSTTGSSTTATPPPPAPAAPALPPSTLTTTPQTLGTTGASATATPVPGTSPPVPVVSTPNGVVTTPPLTGVPSPPTLPGPVVFGSQMFTGRFAALTYSGFNPDYQIAIGDQVLVRLWGAVIYEATQGVDAQGNIFIPNVGPVMVAGVRNGELNNQVEQQVKKVFRANVGVYATLQAAQPVKIYVTGFVRAPGLYGGLSSDSVLYYIDRAGGIDPDRGSYLSVSVQRGGRTRAEIDLYKFLLKGQIDTLQLQDGDTIVIAPRQHTIAVFGEALNPYLFEFPTFQVSAADLIAVARPRPTATHMSIVRSIGLEKRSEYVPLDQIAGVQLSDGDLVTFTADKFPATIMVRINGAQLGERTYVMPYGARLKEAIARLHPAPNANMDGLQLFRISSAQRQKANLDQTVQSLQTAVLSARSATTEEASLRQQEASLILQFIDRVKVVVPLGQVVLNNRRDADEMILEDGDTLNIPEASSMVTVGGEVLFPNSLVYDPNLSTDDYLDLVGGYTQRSDRDKLVIVKPDGTVALNTEKPGPGDQILVLPRVETKYVELTRAITSILYQLAVAARVLETF